MPVPLVPSANSLAGKAFSLRPSSTMGRTVGAWVHRMRNRPRRVTS
jgi:hypothetical protein